MRGFLVLENKKTQKGRRVKVTQSCRCEKERNDRQRKENKSDKKVINRSTVGDYETGKNF